MTTRRRFVTLAAAAGSIAGIPLAPDAAPRWSEIEARARGRTVWFNAWGGSAGVNDHIAWIGQRLAASHGIELRHVKLADTAEAVTRVASEKAAGRTSGGTVDLIWINGENFARMRREGLLHGPFADDLPNARLVDRVGNPTIENDAGLPVEGFESPWGAARFVLLHDTARLAQPPRSIAALGRWAAGHPGRFTYPQPPEFLGTTFLKQALLELWGDQDALLRPVRDDGFAAATAPLFAYLDALHPHLWRAGRSFPASGPELRRLLGDGEVDLAMSFDPLEAAAGIARGLLPPSTRVAGLEGGTIGNTHFVAIPFNAASKEAAMVVADALLAPEAQARQQDPRHWGSLSVLDPGRLSEVERRSFAVATQDPAVPPPGSLGPALAEPHASWTDRLEAGWQRRYLER